MDEPDHGMRLPEWTVHVPPGIDAGSLDVVAERSLPAAWEAAWAWDMSAPVVADVRSARWMSAGELEESSRAAAQRFLRLGLDQGSRVLFSCASSVELVIAHVGALRAGLVVLPVNSSYRPRELSHILRDARPSAAVVDDNGRGADLHEADPGLVVVGPYVDGPARAGTVDLPPPDAASAALMAYTSGTTGVPKGALHSHASLLASARSVAIAWRWSPADRLVLSLPLFHGHGLCVGLHGTLLAGASAVLVPRFGAGAVLDAAAQHRASLFFGVPTMYHRLADSARAGELRSLRLCVSGSAALPAELHRGIEELSGQQILERYGTTETLMCVSNPYEGERRAGTVGFPLPGVQVRLADDGEILVRGPNVFLGYWGQPQQTADAMDGGWYRTGDLGRLDPDGYLRILGRSKELIITGGFNVYPREVEEVLLGHPAVAEAAVVGIPSEEWGEMVIAFVVPTGERCRVDELREFAVRELAAYKLPKELYFVDSLPRNALGKVIKSELVSPRQRTMSRPQ